MTATALHPLAGPRGRKRRERAIRYLFLAVGVVSIVITLAIVAALAWNAIQFYTHVDLRDFLTSFSWRPRRDRFGLPAILSGTLVVTLIALAVAVPVGLGAAVYLSEYASDRVRKAIKPTLEILAGIPSVVLGFFALTFVTPQLVRPLLPGTEAFNMLAAGLCVGLLAIPLVASISEDSMRAVPRALREGAYGLGANKMRVTVTIVMPAALSGLVAGVILAASRAIGETMVVAIAAGGTSGGELGWNPTRGGQTMTGAMAATIGSDQVRVGGVDDNLTYYALFGVGFILLVLTLILNFASERIVRRFRQVY